MIPETVPSIDRPIFSRIQEYRSRFGKWFLDFRPNWELTHNPFLSVGFLLCVLYVTITYTGLVINSENQFIVQYTVFSILVFSVLFMLMTKSKYFYHSKKYIYRFVEISSSVLAYLTFFFFILFALDLNQSVLNLAFVTGLFSSVPLLYLIMRDGVISVANHQILQQMLIRWLKSPEKQARIFSPILNDEMNQFDFIFSSEEIKSSSKSIVDSVSSHGILSLDDAAYFLRSNTGFNQAGASEYNPATSSAIEGLSYSLNSPIQQSRHTRDVEKNTLSQLLFLHIFWDPLDFKSRWTSNSATSLASRNKPSTIFVGDTNLHSPDRIVHYWTFEQLSSAAQKLYNNLHIHSSDLPPDSVNLREWLRICLDIIGKDDAPGRSGNLEQIKIYYYLAILSQSGSLEIQQNKERWKGMVEGYCAGSEFSIGQVTTDSKILQKKIPQPDHQTIRRRINLAFQNPIDQFVKSHDDLLELFDYDNIFDEKESNYIDGVIEKMMERLHRTTYLEQQVKRGHLPAEDLIDRRKGIIAGITISILVVMDSLRVPK